MIFIIFFKKNSKKLIMIVNLQIKKNVSPIFLKKTNLKQNKFKINYLSYILLSGEFK